MIGVATSVWLGAFLSAQGFNLRTGAWQFTINMQVPMEGLPPQVREELAKPQISNSCVTPEDIKELNLGRTEDSDDEDCKILTLKMTPTSADITRQCTGDDAYTEIAHFEAPTPQTVAGTVSRKSAEGTMTITMTGRWVAAECAE
jgi:hypothetical protein